jgi:Helix-turn-helix domain
MTDSAGGGLLGDLLTETELATALKKSLRTVRRWRRAGAGPPHVQLGRDVLYSKTSFQGWITSREIDCSKRPSRRRY